VNELRKCDFCFLENFSQKTYKTPASSARTSTQQGLCSQRKEISTKKRCRHCVRNRQAQFSALSIYEKSAFNSIGRPYLGGKLLWLKIDRDKKKLTRSESHEDQWLSNPNSLYKSIRIRLASSRFCWKLFFYTNC